jgi:DNA-binding winged helix-turn-helix (wHTH) protein/Tol biopolymer transport system component
MERGVCEPVGPPQDAVFRFGAFELQAETGELFKHGVRIRLQSKPLLILQALLVKPGELVTREVLRGELWPAGTFVDFESGLNTATNRLRAALKDSADSPRYIETVPRAGYRFICPVTKLEPERAEPPATFQNPERAREFRHVQRSCLRKLSQAIPVIILGTVVALAFAYLNLRDSVHHQPPRFRQLNFRAGLVESARFLARTNNAAYTTLGGGAEQHTIVVSLDGSDSRTLAGATGALTAVSEKGELAMIEKRPRLGSSMLVRFVEDGPAVSMLTEHLRCADWLPDGEKVALVSAHGTESWVEFPAGHVVYRSSAFLDNLRVSPTGDEIAFLEHPVRDDDEGYPMVADRRGNSKILTQLWSSANGLAWSPTGREVWFTAARTGLSRALYAVSMDGILRLVSNTPSSMHLFDISPAGRVLIALDDMHTAMVARLANDSAERDVSNLDSSHVDDMSADGQLILFTEAGNAGGQRYSAYTFDRQSGRAIRFAAGRGFALSPDKGSAITIDPKDRGFLTLTYLGRGRSRRIQGNGFEYQWVKFLPDGRSILAGGAYPGHPFQICTQSLGGGRPEPLKNSTYMDSVQVSPNGQRIAGRLGDKAIIVDLATGAQQNVPLDGIGDPIAWSRDGQDIFFLLFNPSPYRLVRADLRTGRVKNWEMPAASGMPDLAGLNGAVAAPSANAYAYSRTYTLSTLYVVDGWS